MLAACWEVWKMERGRFYQQFGERSGSGEARNTVIPPLAANIVRLMEQAREGVRRRGFTEFYPQFWMYDKILEVSVEMGDRNAEVRNAIADVSTAYGIAAYPQFTPRQKDQLRTNLRQDIRRLHIGSVTLNEQQRELLQHIATATSTPIDPDQTEYEYTTILAQLEITAEEMERDPRYNTW
jgi:hypothetical protein